MFFSVCYFFNKTYLHYNNTSVDKNVFAMNEARIKQVVLFKGVMN